MIHASNTSALPRLSPAWRERLTAVLADVLDFREYSAGNGRTLRAESQNSRAVIEVCERQGVLEKSSLQIALPDHDELELLKLSCWTLIWLKALFPDWKDVEAWVQSAADKSCATKGNVHQQLHAYSVSCRYDEAANVLDYEISRTPAHLAP